MNKIRRVVTSINRENESIIHSDQWLEPTVKSSEFPGIEITEIWGTKQFPIDLNQEYESMETFSRDLAPGHTRFGILRMPPLKKLLAYQKKQGFSVKNIDEFRLHKTNTLDYVTILSGQMTLVLESGEKTLLKTGDLLVQRRTMHTWHNEEKEDCIMSIVQIGIKG